MIIEPAMKVLNRLERDGVIDRYARGGAFATLFSMEPILTSDLDVFVFTKPEASPLAPLSAIDEYIRESGAAAGNTGTKNPWRGEGRDPASILRFVDARSWGHKETILGLLKFNRNPFHGRTGERINIVNGNEPIQTRFNTHVQKRISAFLF